MQSVTHTAPMVLKQHKIDTNFCGKMDLDEFIHIDLAPGPSILESVMKRTVFEIIAKDGSHPPVLVQLTDLYRFPAVKLETLPDDICLKSHGMASGDLVGYMVLKYRQILSLQTQCAIYYYSKFQTPTNGNKNADPVF